MRLLILGSVALPVPPAFQGGTEWMAYYQAKGLADRGHEVTLIAAHGSKPGPYRLIEVGKGDTVIGSESQKDGECIGSIVESSRPLRKETVYLSEVMRILLDQKDSYDIVLNNMRGEAVFVPIAKLLGKPFATVCHLPLFTELAEFFRQHKTHVITISDAQRREFPDLTYLATVYNGVDIQTYSYCDKPKDYMLMMGSIAKHKNQAAAIRVAKKLGMKLVLAGKINDPAYYHELEADIDGEQIIHVGEIGFPDKLKLYQEAKAFLFPIEWPEPFGLVMIEAMASGTPVVAYGNGAIPEVVKDGETGYIVQPDAGEDGLCRAMEKIHSMPAGEYETMRLASRTHVEQKFSVEKMVDAYDKALTQL